MASATDGVASNDAPAPTRCASSGVALRARMALEQRRNDGHGADVEVAVGQFLDDQSGRHAVHTQPAEALGGRSMPISPSLPISRSSARSSLPAEFALSVGGQQTLAGVAARRCPAELRWSSVRIMAGHSDVCFLPARPRSRLVEELRAAFDDRGVVAAEGVAQQCLEAQLIIERAADHFEDRLFRRFDRAAIVAQDASDQVLGCRHQLLVRYDTRDEIRRQCALRRRSPHRSARAPTRCRRPRC